MSGLAQIAIVWLVASVVMLAGWLQQRRTRNAGIVDALWASCMAGSAVFYAISGTGALLPRILVGAMGALWGLRLAAHIWARVRRESEDGRYLALRRHWNDDQIRFLLFFLGQAVLTVLFSLPFWIAVKNPLAEWSIWYSLAIAIWMIALVGEWIADHQLAAFRADAAMQGRTCRRGLWRYSRHPNYFFEWLHWFAYVALAVGCGTAWVMASLIGPVLMLCTLYWVTGIPYTEAQALRTRGDDYRVYQRTTSALIPWFPRA
jgi:steroid 5-alpha reductase family enzyme